MPRIRTVKPEFFRSKILAGCSPRARLTFIGLWTLADDEGRYEYEPELLKADLWPWEHDVTAKEADACVLELEARGRVCLYQHAGKTYLHIVNWHEHQKISHPSKSRFPSCHRETHGDPPEPSGGFQSTPEASLDAPEESGALQPDLGSGPRKGIRERDMPSGRSATAGGLAPIHPIPTAQTLVAAYVDAYRGRAGHDPPSRVKGQLAKELGRLIGDGIPPDAIKAGFIEWFERDQHPSTLASFVESNGRGGQPGRRTRQQQGRAQLLETDDILGRWATSDEGGDDHGQARMAGTSAKAQRQLPRPGATP
jgi:hypothetical protein